MSHKLASCLSCKGRISKEKFQKGAWLWMALAIFIVSPLLSLVIKNILAMAGLAHLFPFVNTLVLGIVIYAPLIGVLAQRLHDVGASGLWQTAILMPVIIALVYAVMRPDAADWILQGGLVTGILPGLIITLFMVIMLGITPGKKGANQYGSDPLETSND